MHLSTFGEKFLKPRVEVVDIDWWDIEDYLRFGCEGWNFGLFELFVAVADDFLAWFRDRDVSCLSIPKGNSLSEFKRCDSLLKEVIEVVAK